MTTREPDKTSGWKSVPSSPSGSRLDLHLQEKPGRRVNKCPIRLGTSESAQPTTPTTQPHGLRPRRSPTRRRRRAPSPRRAAQGGGPLGPAPGAEPAPPRVSAAAPAAAAPPPPPSPAVPPPPLAPVADPCPGQAGVKRLGVGPFLLLRVTTRDCLVVFPSSC